MTELGIFILYVTILGKGAITVNLFKFRLLVMRFSFLLIFFFCLIFPSWVSAVRNIPLERRMLEKASNWDLSLVQEDRRCNYSERYKVYLIDNFRESIDLIHEIETSHGDVMMRMIRSGRNDIDVEVINSGLTRGLALVLQYLEEGGCADAIISSVPGSNYHYRQLDVFLDKPQPVKASNILRFRSQLRQRFLDIAFNGFPSFEWLFQLEANPSKVQNDARKIALIEAIGTFSIPVILPYGNVDTDFTGELREVNVLSLANNAKIFSALDKDGRPLEDYPTSPLQTGGARALYHLEECPNFQSPYHAVLDINEDRDFDYVFKRDDFLAYLDGSGKIRYAPALTYPDSFQLLLENIVESQDCSIFKGKVLTTEQYIQLIQLCSTKESGWQNYTYHWIRSTVKPDVLSFNPTCRSRGTLYGTSLIPPNIVKKYLPEKEG